MTTILAVSLTASSVSANTLSVPLCEGRPFVLWSLAANWISVWWMGRYVWNTVLSMHIRRQGICEKSRSDLRLGRYIIPNGPWRTGFTGTRRTSVSTRSMISGFPILLWAARRKTLSETGSRTIWMNVNGLRWNASSVWLNTNVAWDRL